MTNADGADPILRAEDLTKYYDTSDGLIDSLLGRSQRVKAVDGVDLELYEGETLGVVGESGCGKSTLGQALLGLLEPTDGSVTYRRRVDSRGSARREEIEITDATEGTLRDLRTDLQYVFQDPFSSLNPRLTVGDIVGEPLDVHGIAAGRARTDRIGELLETVGLHPNHAYRYPHEFSGGQRQRIGIARALAVEPEVVVCDEPVSALDVSVQAQILNLLQDLQEEFGLSYVVISHDLRVVEHVSDRTAVMYLGEFAEVGPTDAVFSPPHHPYTEALLSAIPEPDPRRDRKGDRIRLSGTVPSPIDPPSGCRFHTRCPRLIQPSGYDLEREEWRSIVDLKRRVTDADGLESITALDGEQTGRDQRSDPAADSRERVDELVREAFGIPSPVSDPAAERSLSTVIDALHADGVAVARERLKNAFASPCEASDPERVRTGEAHEIGCLHYGDRDADGENGAPADGISDPIDSCSSGSYSPNT